MTKSYVNFVVVKEKPKTKVFAVQSKSDGISLGVIYWYGPWRQYIFQTMTGSEIWSRGCLKEVTAFMDKLMDERKQKVTIKVHATINEGEVKCGTGREGL